MNRPTWLIELLRPRISFSFTSASSITPSRHDVPVGVVEHRAHNESGLYRRADLAREDQAEQVPVTSTATGTPPRGNAIATASWHPKPSGAGKQHIGVHQFLAFKPRT